MMKIYRRQTLKNVREKTIREYLSNQTCVFWVENDKLLAFFRRKRLPDIIFVLSLRQNKG